MKCEECEQGASEVCVECEETLCNSCSLKLHSGGKRRYHELRKMCENCLEISNVSCIACQLDICKKCQIEHLTHQTVSKTRTIVYWDSSYIPESSQMSLVYHLIKLQPTLIKIYSKYHSPRLLFGNNIAVHHRPFHFSKIFSSDLKSDTKYGVTDCYIISELSPELAGLTINTLTMINFYHLDPNTLISCPLGYSHIIQLLYSKFVKGKLLLNYSKFLMKFPKQAKTFIINALSNLQTFNKLSRTTKTFNQFTLQQISLTIQELTPKICLSILRSLKLDEIFPSEKAIQSRIREAFSQKLSNSEWINLIKCMQSAKADSNFTFFSNNLEPQFHFRQIIYEDEKTFAIYPVGEEWTSCDQFDDVQSIKATSDWREMLEFLSGFFKSDVKFVTLTGGKYGCALMLKNFGPECLRKLSIGKLSFMIQISINEDILRYQKTLLVWAENFQVLLPESIIKDRIQTIHRELIKLLKTKPSGLPLAQIPIFLKRRLKFPLKLPDLGYKKLKDLLATFPEIYLHPANSKNPSAFLSQTSSAMLLLFINSQIEKNTFSMSESQLNSDLFSQFGVISWGNYKSYNLLDFVTQHCKTVKIMKVGNDCIFIGREMEKEELSISTHNSEYVVMSCDEKFVEMSEDLYF